ncbi:MAG: acyl carrier protein [Clostridia bacterium]|nr:acyl carrier protein [Clostridia bacterium]
MVLDKIIALVAEQFRLDEDELSEDTSFEEIGADDMDIADLVLAVEDAFETEISIEEANALKTIGDLTDLAEKAWSAGE